MSFIIMCVILGIMCTDIYCEGGDVYEDFSTTVAQIEIDEHQQAENIRLARNDYKQSLETAYNLANPKANKEELEAKVEFENFLDSWLGDEFIEAFYGREQANRFTQFLKGILFNGNPSLPVWKATETLLNMIRTKLDENEIEKLRNKLSSP